MIRERKATAVTLLANSRCPHCVQAVDRMTEWAIEEGVAVAAVDLWAHPEAAGWFEAETSPVVVLEGGRPQVHLGMPDHAAFHRLVAGG